MKNHIGHIIKEKVKTSGLNVSKFAKMINVERSNVYNIYERESIDTELLNKIGQTLNYDFFQHYVDKNHTQSSQRAKISIEFDLDDYSILNKKLGEILKETFEKIK